MLEQKDAIIRLLRDDDPGTVQLVKEQLAQRGAEAVPDLRDLLLIDDEAVTRHAREVIGEIDAKAAAAELTALCPVFAEDGDLEAANWLLARALIPGIDPVKYMRKLDALAVKLIAVREASDPEDRVLMLATVLSQRAGFEGNSEDYYQAANSLLPRVIDTKLGIPISLAMIYMFVGRRCGLVVEGVNFPGHFLARHQGVLFDPFDHGRIIGITDCKQILARQKLQLQSNYLEAATARVMLRRILANLLYAYQNENGTEQAASITLWLHALERK